MRYLLNSAVITAPGTYTYQIIGEDAAAEWVRAGGWESRIGYPATADHIQALSGVRPPMSRGATSMQPGDAALVVRLKYRLDNPAAKAAWRPSPHDWEYGIMRREA